MSGHSKWANIKRRKAVVDEKKGRVFSRLAREISALARAGGPNPDANAALKAAIDRAREQNLPMDNIQRAIARGAGTDGGSAYEEIWYEGFGPGAVAILVEAMTDNRNRTAADIRHLFSRHGGNLGESGSVGWMFDVAGVVNVPKAGLSEDVLMERVLEAGADDLQSEDDMYVVLCQPAALLDVRAALVAAGVPVLESEVSRLPKVRTHVAGDDAARLLHLLDVLEDHDDVQRVYANFDMDEDELEKLENA